MKVAGLTPATFIYVTFGTSMAEVDSAAYSASLPLLVCLFVISIVPVYLRLLARFEPRA